MLPMRRGWSLMMYQIGITSKGIRGGVGEWVRGERGRYGGGCKRARVLKSM